MRDIQNYSKSRTRDKDAVLNGFQYKTIFCSTIRFVHPDFLIKFNLFVQFDDTDNTLLFQMELVKLGSFQKKDINSHIADNMGGFLLSLIMQVTKDASGMVTMLS